MKNVIATDTYTTAQLMCVFSTVLLLLLILELNNSLWCLSVLHLYACALCTQVIHSLYFSFLFSLSKITIIPNNCDLSENVTETDDLFHLLLLNLQFLLHFLFLFHSPGCNFNPHKIQMYFFPNSPKS